MCKLMRLFQHLNAILLKRVLLKTIQHSHSNNLISHIGFFLTPRGNPIANALYIVCIRISCARKIKVARRIGKFANVQEKDIVQR